MGRTPSPNFIKKIAGIMNFNTAGNKGVDNIYLQNILVNQEMMNATNM